MTRGPRALASELEVDVKTKKCWAALRLGGLACAALCGVEAAWAARVLTLEGAVRAALQAHPNIAASRALDRAQVARVGEAFAGYLPSVGYNFNYTRRTANCVNQPANFPCDAVPRPNAGYDTFNFWSAGVAVVQPIWDFGRTSNAHEAAKLGARATRAQVRASRFQVALDTKAAFFNVLAQGALVQVARDALAQQRATLAQAEGFVRAGTRTRIDAAQAEAEVATAELNLLRAENAQRQAKAVLLGAMGEPAEDLSFELEAPARRPLVEESLPISELVRRASASRPDLHALEAEALRLEANIGVARAGYWPQLALQVGPTFAGTEIANLSTNFAATVTLSVPGGSVNPYFTHQQTAEFRALATAARAQATRLRNEIHLEIQNARLTLETAKRVVLTADRAIAAATERLNLADGRYRAGAGTLLERSDAQVALVSAKGARVQAEYEVEVARAQLVRAIGLD